MEATTTITVEEYNRLVNTIKQLEQRNESLLYENVSVKEIKKDVEAQVFPATVELFNEFMRVLLKEIGLDDDPFFLTKNYAKFSDPEFRYREWGYRYHMSLENVDCTLMLDVSKFKKAIYVYFEKLMKEE